MSQTSRLLHLPRPPRCRYRTSNSCSRFFEFCSRFYALFIGCSSKEEGFILSGLKSLFLHCFCLKLLNLKQMIVYGQILCICLHANEGRKSKTKDSVNNAHLNFWSFFSGEKKGKYKGKYGKKKLLPCNFA